MPKRFTRKSIRNVHFYYGRCNGCHRIGKGYGSMCIGSCIQYNAVILKTYMV